jgi:dipeptidyl aminopeptidase/acylaminoacyl peptidase
MDRRAVVVGLAVCVTFCVTLFGSGCSQPEVVPAKLPTGGPTAWNTLPSGARHAEVRLSRAGNPAQVLWVYLPPKATSAKGLPCVFVAPAGTPLIHGSNLGNPPEYVPYAKAGFAVVAYAIDGNVENAEDDAQMVRGIRAFLAADGGVLNARAAMNYAVETLGADPKRLYVAGHSSAGTLALQVAASDPRVAGCIAYAPCSDIPTFLGENLAPLSKALPEVGRYVARSSPHARAADLKCPVFLFQAADDGVIPPRTTRNFAELVRRTNPRVTYEEVPSGNHYDSMINEGIPRAVAWLKKQGNKNGP